MTVALFVPCYIDQFYPGVAIATLQLLEKLGVDVVYPQDQLCCGQPMANAGFESITRVQKQCFERHFGSFGYVVSPSGSCVLHLKEHVAPPQVHVMELTEFLTDVLQVTSLPATFPHRVGMHQSCHGQRGLGLSSMSEMVMRPFSKPERLLRMVNGLELVPLDRTDECCGFGGTFSVYEEAVSVKMGKDRIRDHEQHGAEFITGNDMSCLMHLEGILKRGNSPVKVIHIAEILNAS